MIRSYDNGQFVNLSNIDNWIDYYYRNKLYKSSSFEDYPNKYFSHVFLWGDDLKGRVIDEGQSVFDSYQGMTIIDRKLDYTSFYFFSVTEENSLIKNLYINTLDKIYRFIAHFEAQAKNLILSNLTDDRKYLYEELYIANPLPDLQALSNKNLTHATDKKNLFAHYLKNTENFPTLTEKERTCLAYLLKGLSAKEIARITHNSARTIELYVASIKNKFDCTSTLKLISKLYNDHHHLALSLQNSILF